jgi:hypothetical protein
VRRSEKAVAFGYWLLPLAFKLYALTLFYPASSVPAELKPNLLSAPTSVHYQANSFPDAEAGSMLPP